MRRQAPITTACRPHSVQLLSRSLQTAACVWPQENEAKTGFVAYWISAESYKNSSGLHLPPWGRRLHTIRGAARPLHRYMRLLASTSPL